MFSEKLNFLMSIIGISGGELAHAVSLDPSYISRLRNGKRALPKGQNFLEDIAEYFAEQIQSDYQKKLLCEAMNYKEIWPKDIEEARHQIQGWLLREEGGQREKLKGVLSTVVSSYLVDLVLSPSFDLDLSQLQRDSREYYFGDSGKQEAFLRFLALALDGQESKEMYLFTNEDPAWLSSDGEYAIKTNSLLSSFAHKGNRIKVVHPILQNIDDMIFMMQQWIPVYLTGFVEPYYYPKIKDDFYKRTAFVLPGTAALVGSTMNGNKTDSMTTVLTDPRAIAAVESELNFLISQSKPLAQVYSARDHQGIWSMLDEFYNAQVPAMILHDYLTPFQTMGQSLTGQASREGVCFDLASADALMRNSYVEIISRPDLEKIRAGRVPVQLTELVGERPELLSPQEYLENLERTIQLLETYDNYHVMIVPHIFFNLYLCAKQGIGVLISKAEKGKLGFYIQQKDVVDAVWEYMNALKPKTTPANKQAVLAELKELAQTLRQQY